MPVHVDNIESSVELRGVPAPGDGGAARAASTLPTWQERERLRLVRELAERDASRLCGEGIGV